MRNYFFTLIFISLHGCSHAEDLDVMKTALSSYCKGNDVYILQSEAIEPPSRDQLSESLIKDVGEDLINALYNSKNSPSIAEKMCSQVSVEKSLTIKKALEGKKEVKDIVFEDEHWAHFYHVFPGVKGVIYISSVAYSSNRKSAIIFLASACGPLCGGSTFIVVSHKKQKWRHVKSVQFSQS
ncbi:MAG TPA: hypothetical protein VIM59_18290 [Cellvibrio sp.]